MSDAVLGWLFQSWRSDSDDWDSLGHHTREASRADDDIADRNTTDRNREREWIAGLRGGRIDVFRVVFDTYGPSLRRFAGIWAPRDVAEDIVQDVLFDVWQRRQELDEESGNLTAYLYAAVRNRVTSYRRHASVASRIEQQHPVSELPGMGAAPPATDTEAVTEDLHATIRSALVELPEIQRAVLMLRWAEEMSYAEIATALAITPNAAMIHASRARKVLHRVFKELQ